MQAVHNVFPSQADLLGIEWDTLLSAPVWLSFIETSPWEWSKGSGRCNYHWRCEQVLRAVVVSLVTAINTTHWSKQCASLKLYEDQQAPSAKYENHINGFKTSDPAGDDSALRGAHRGSQWEETCHLLGTHGGMQGQRLEHSIEVTAEKLQDTHSARSSRTQEHPITWPSRLQRKLLDGLGWSLGSYWDSNLEWHCLRRQPVATVFNFPTGMNKANLESWSQGLTPLFHSLLWLTICTCRFGASAH